MSTKNDSLVFFTTDPFQLRHCAAIFCSIIVIPHRHSHIRILRSTYNLAARPRLMRLVADPVLLTGIVITFTSLTQVYLMPPTMLSELNSASRTSLHASLSMATPVLRPRRMILNRRSISLLTD
jgi:hypothetical protein